MAASADKLAYDASFAPPNPVDAEKAGYSVAIRYISQDPKKDISKAEAARIHAAGLGIGLVWETTAMRATQGKDAGIADGNSVHAKLSQLGAPPGTPIFANIGDWQTTSGQIGGIAAYYRGFRNSLREYRPGSGGYGNAFIINTLARFGHIGIWWQNAITTESVSGDIVSAHASIYQRVRPTRVITGAERGSWDESAYGYGPVPDISWWWPAAAPAPGPQPGKAIKSVHVVITYTDDTTDILWRD